MIDTRRTVPIPEAAAWSFDLSPVEGPRFAVLRLSEAEARELLAEHLVDLGKAEDRMSGLASLAGVAAERVAVVW